MSCGKCKKPGSKGFTLIELLVVIAIIAILAIIVLIALNNARTKARDSKAISAVRSIVPALELYNDDNTTYPQRDTFALMGTDLAGDNLLPGGVPSPDANYAYCYCSNAPESYKMAAVRGTCANPTILPTPGGQALGDPNLNCVWQ